MSVSGIHGHLLEVTVVGCNRLKDTEWISRQDPYVCLEYASTKYRTRTCTDGGKTPTFQEKFTVTLIEGLREINLTVWNSNTLSHDDFIGNGRVQLHKVLSQGFDDTPWSLQSKSGRYAGEVRLIMHYANAKHPAVTYAPSAPSYAAPPPPQVPLYSAPPPTISASYPPPAAAYPTPSPYPAYPSYPSSIYPPQPAAYPPPPSTYPPPPPRSSYPPASPYYPPVLAIVWCMRMHRVVRRSYDKDLDTFRHYFLILASFILALLVHEKFTIQEIFWAFSIYLEALAILPQLVLLQRSGNVDNLTGQYVFFLGAYRAFYILNWIYRYFMEQHFSRWIACVSGMVQTALYADFFYYYFISWKNSAKLNLPA